MKAFRQKYIIKKLKKHHNILSSECGPNDIQLVCLHANDKSASHAVTVVNGLIFDSTCIYAMNLSHCALNKACNGSEFVAIAKGYLFQMR